MLTSRSQHLEPANSPTHDNPDGANRALRPPATAAHVIPGAPVVGALPAPAPAAVFSLVGLGLDQLRDISRAPDSAPATFALDAAQRQPVADCAACGLPAGSAFDAGSVVLAAGRRPAKEIGGLKHGTGRGSRRSGFCNSILLAGTDRRQRGCAFHPPHAVS